MNELNTNLILTKNQGDKTINLKTISYEYLQDVISLYGIQTLKEVLYLLFKNIDDPKFLIKITKEINKEENLVSSYLDGNLIRTDRI